MILSIVSLLLMMVNSCNEKTNNPVVRPATQADRFYTGNPKELSAEVDSFLALHRDRTMYEHVAALIVPHAGYYFSGNVAASAYMTIPTNKPYKRIFLLGPSHHEWLDGASINMEQRRMTGNIVWKCNCLSCSAGLKKCLLLSPSSSPPTTSRS